MDLMVENAESYEAFHIDNQIEIKNKNQDQIAYLVKVY